MPPESDRDRIESKNKALGTSGIGAQLLYSERDLEGIPKTGVR